MAAPFSYAQAARGVAPSADSNEKDFVDQPTAESTATVDVVSSSAPENAYSSENATENENVQVPSAIASTEKSSEQESTIATGEADHGNEDVEPETSVEASAEQTDDGKAESAHDDAPKESEEKKTKPVVLTDAPAPAVNIWQERQAQLAKTRPAQASKAKSMGEDNDASKKDATTGSSSGSNSNNNNNKSQDQRKTGGNNHVRRSDKSSPKSTTTESLDDPTSWPTLTDVPRIKATSAEKPNASREASESLPKRGKTWEKVPFTPTYESHIPHRGGPRRGRGGGGARGGASSGTRSSHRDQEKSTGVGKSSEKESSKDVSTTNSSSPSPSATTAITEPDSYSESNAAQSPSSKAADVSSSSLPNKPEASAASAGASATSSGFGASAGVEYKKSSTFSNRKSYPYGNNNNNNNNNTSKYVPEQGSSGEGRTSRGGYRGRGGYHGAMNGGHHHQNGYNNSGYYQNGSNAARHGNNTRYTNGYSSRGGDRGGSRNSGSFSRLNMTPIQTSQVVPGYLADYGASTAPFPTPSTPWLDPVTDSRVLHFLVNQIYYYFSIDNLVKDMYLRKKMNQDGFVPISVIADFKRIKATIGALEIPDRLEPIRDACAQLSMIRDEEGLLEFEFVVGQTEPIEYIRRRDMRGLGLDKEAGPPFPFYPHPRAAANNAAANPHGGYPVGPGAGPYDYVSPTMPYGGNVPLSPYGVPMVSPTAPDFMYGNMAPAAPNMLSMGHVMGHYSHNYPHTHTQLSANVAEFSPKNASPHAETNVPASTEAQPTPSAVAQS